MSVVNEHPPPRYEEQVVIPETQPPLAGDEDEILVRGEIDWLEFLLNCRHIFLMTICILFVPCAPFLCLKCCTFPYVWRLTLTKSGIQYTSNKLTSCRVKTIFIPLEDIADIYILNSPVRIKTMMKQRRYVRGKSEVTIKFVSNVVEFVIAVRREMGLPHQHA